MIAAQTPSPSLVLIPARLGSSRYPGKALAPLLGRPLLSHVLDRARGAWPDARACVVTDAQEIARALEPFGEVVLDQRAAPCGTDRLSAAVKTLGVTPEWIVNLQGDEPCVPPEALRAALATLQARPDAHMGSACVPMTRADDFRNPDLVKVVCDDTGSARYFSRAPIPHQDAQHGLARWWLHIGVYAFRGDTLTAFSAMGPSWLEQTERLEQLRALQAGWTIAMATLHSYQDRPWPSVNRPEDLAQASAYLTAST